MSSSTASASSSTPSTDKNLAEEIFLDLDEDRGEPVLLIRADDNGRFSLTPEGRAIISVNPSRPVMIVSVVGLARQGKSTLCNRLLARSAGFDVGDSVHAQTRGLWIWSEPIRRSYSEHSDRKTNIFLVDAEGLASFEVHSNNDASLFTLALLISSAIVYNSKGAIDERAIDQLGIVAELSGKFQEMASDLSSQSLSNGVSARSLLHQPVLCWVLRDFQLNLTDRNGSRMSENSYLEMALESAPNPSSTQLNRNAIRQGIRNLFSERHCIAMPYPVEKVQDLKQVKELRMDQLSPEFVKKLDELRSVIAMHANPITFGSGPILPSTLLVLMDAYVDAMNNGGIPVIKNRFEHFAEKYDHDLMHRLSGLVSDEIRSISANVSISQSEFLTASQTLLSKFESEYRRQSLFGSTGEMFTRLLNNLSDLIRELAESRSATNREEFDQRVDEFASVLKSYLSRLDPRNIDLMISSFWEKIHEFHNQAVKLSAYKEKFHHTFQHFSDILHHFVRRSHSELLSAYNRAQSTISSLERRLQSVSNLQSAMNSEKIELSKSLAEKEELVRDLEIQVNYLRGKGDGHSSMNWAHSPPLFPDSLDKSVGMESSVLSHDLYQTDFLPPRMLPAKRGRESPLSRGDRDTSLDLGLSSPSHSFSLSPTLSGLNSSVLAPSKLDIFSSSGISSSQRPFDPTSISAKLLSKRIQETFPDKWNSLKKQPKNKNELVEIYQEWSSGES